MTDVPVRLSLDDPDYTPELGTSLVITLNGAVQHKVLSYDTVKGEVTRYRTDESGNIVLNQARDQAEVETVHGDVVVTRR